MPGTWDKDRINISYCITLEYPKVKLTAFKKSCSVKGSTFEFQGLITLCPQKISRRDKDIIKKICWFLEKSSQLTDSLKQFTTQGNGRKQNFPPWIQLERWPVRGWASPSLGTWESWLWEIEEDEGEVTSYIMSAGSHNLTGFSFLTNEMRVVHRGFFRPPFAFKGNNPSKATTAWGRRYRELVSNNSTLQMESVLLYFNL